MNNVGIGIRKTQNGNSYKDEVVEERTVSFLQLADHKKV